METITMINPKVEETLFFPVCADSQSYVLNVVSVQEKR